jgi:hypothetical protein
MRQVRRTLTAADEGALVDHRVLICDRDAKWSAPVRARLGEAGIRVVQTSLQAPNANAYAERFVRSIKHKCLNRSRSANVICAGRSPSSSSITTVSGITKGSATNSSTARRLSMASIGFTVVSGSAGSSIITLARRDDA